MLKKEKKRAAEGRPSKSDLGNGHVTTSSAKLSSRDQNRGERHKGQDRSVATPPDSRAIMFAFKFIFNIFYYLYYNILYYIICILIFYIYFIVLYIIIVYILL